MKASKSLRHGAVVLVPMALAGALALVWTAPASAQTLDDDYWITGQAYFPRIDTNVRVSSTRSQAVGTDVDLEKDLALDNDEVLPEVTAGARFGRVIVGLDYFRLKRTGEISLARDITFDDVTYHASADVNSSFASDIYRLTVGYAIVQQDNLEIAAALGLHATDFDLRIRGEGTVGNASAQSEVRRKKFLAPVPTVGASLTYRVAPKLDLNARFDWLSLKVGDYDGRLINTQAGLTYRVFDHVGLGVAYRYVDYRVGVEKQRWEGRTRYKLHGPAVILQASF